MTGGDMKDSQEFGPPRSGRTAIARGVEGVSELEALRLGVVLEVASDAVVAVDQDGLVVLLNARAEQLFGFAREELVGKPVELLVPSGARATHVLYRCCYVADPQPRRFEVSAARRDGSEFPIEITLNTLGTEAGFLVVAAIRDITERKRAEAQSARLSAIVGCSREAIIAVSLDGVVTDWNAGAERIYGYSTQEAIGMPISVTHASAEQNELLIEVLRRVGEGEVIEDLELARKTRDGRLIEVALSVSPVRDARGAVVGAAAAARDITERKQASAALSEAQDRFRYAFEESPVGMMLLDLELRFTQANDAFCRIVGYTREQLLGTSFAAITHPDDIERNREGIRAILDGSQGVYHSEKRYIHASGGTVHVTVHAALLRSPDGAPLSFLSHAQDITDGKRHARQLEYLADHDALTGLLNRRAFIRELVSHAAMLKRRDATGSVMVIDLDHFKFLNDTLGHQAGDSLIVRAAEVLSSRLRSSDLLARLGGDEFGVLLPNADSSAAVRVAESLRAAIREQAIEIGHSRDSLTASIGIASFKDSDGLSGGDVLVNADLAMYDAKEDGRDRAAVFANAEHTEARTKSRITWAHRIQKALAQDRFTLLAQPIVHLSSGAVTQYELLLRMLDDHDELIPPAAFLEVAERLDLIQKIDMWVISRAIRMLAELDDHAAEVAFEINLSGASIGNPELLAHIEHELHSFQIDPARVIFEITETAAL
ncbi:MAG: PAS domain S-box protein, partial [Solirubrobacteraceae bacterium]